MLLYYYEQYNVILVQESILPEHGLSPVLHSVPSFYNLIGV